jgi:hypothetical protein
MTASANIKLVGVKDDLRTIQKLDKSLRREITKEYKKIVEEPVAAIKGSLPTSAPLSGWERKWTTRSGYLMLPWDVSLAPRGIKPFVSGKQPREFRGVVKNLAVFGIKWTAAQATLFDMSRNANTPQGEWMVRGLNNRFGKASRVMWPGYERYADRVEKEVRVLVDGVAKAADRLTRSKAA